MRTMNIKDVKYSRIFTNIKTAMNIIIGYFSFFIYGHNKAQVIVQNQLLFIIVL